MIKTRNVLLIPITYYLLCLIQSLYLYLIWFAPFVLFKIQTSSISSRLFHSHFIPVDEPPSFVDISTHHPIQQDPNKSINQTYHVSENIFSLIVAHSIASPHLSPHYFQPVNIHTIAFFQFIQKEKKKIHTYIYVYRVLFFLSVYQDTQDREGKGIHLCMCVCVYVIGQGEGDYVSQYGERRIALYLFVKETKKKTTDNNEKRFVQERSQAFNNRRLSSNACLRRDPIHFSFVLRVHIEFRVRYNDKFYISLV